MYISLSAQFYFILVFSCFVSSIVLNWNLLNFFIFHLLVLPKITCVFLYELSICVYVEQFILRVVDLIQYYKQMYATVLRTCDVCSSDQERLVFIIIRILW